MFLGSRHSAYDESVFHKCEEMEFDDLRLGIGRSRNGRFPELIRGASPNRRSTSALPCWQQLTIPIGSPHLGRGECTLSSFWDFGMTVRATAIGYAHGRIVLRILVSVQSCARIEIRCLNCFQHLAIGPAVVVRSEMCVVVDHSRRLHLTRFYQPRSRDSACSPQSCTEKSPHPTSRPSSVPLI